MIEILLFVTIRQIVLPVSVLDSQGLKAPDQMENGNMCLGIVSRKWQYVFSQRKVPRA